MIRVAFATNDRAHVNLHFGAAESFVVYDVAPGEAELVGVGSFQRAVMKGDNKDKGLPDDEVPPPVLTASADPDLAVPEDKVIAKLEFLQGCVAVYAASIGTSSIKRLMAIGIQPIIVDNGHDITDLLNEVSLAMVHGGLSWVERAMAKLRPVTVAAKAPSRGHLRLITSIED